MAGDGTGLRWVAVLVIVGAVLLGLYGILRTQDVMLLFFALGLATMLLVLVAAAHVLLRKDLAGVQRLVWLLAVVFVNPVLPLGAGAYLLMGRARTRALLADVAAGGRASTREEAQ